MKPTHLAVLILCLIPLLLRAQVLQPITAQDALAQVTARAQLDLGQNTVPTNVIFLGLQYQNVALTLDAQTGKATGWVYRFYAPSLDSVQFYVAVKIPVAGILVASVPLDTISQILPFNVGNAMLIDPWVDSPVALAASMSGGAAAFYQTHADARVALAVLVNNPVQNPILPAGEFWMITHIATGDTMTCLITAETGDPLRCTSTKAPKITSLPKTVARVGELYSYDVDARGEPAPTYSLSAKPAGMVIDSVSGIISWTPTAQQVGLANVNIKAQNTNGTDVQSYQIVVEESARPPKITSQPPAEVLAGDVYQYQLTASGSPRPVYLLGAGPTGMIIDQGRGIVNWSPTRAQAGQHQIAIVARNTAGLDTQRYTLTVVAEPRLPTFQNQRIKAGQLLSLTATAEGYPAPQYTLLMFPTGMTIDNNSGALTWTPTLQQLGSHNVIVEARNRVGAHPQGFTVQVDDPTALLPIPDAADLRIESISPQPVRIMQPVLMVLRSGLEGRMQLDITDALGRIVWSSSVYVGMDAPVRLQWDLRDVQGKAVPAGVYFARASMHGKFVQQSLQVLR